MSNMDRNEGTVESSISVDRFYADHSLYTCVWGFRFRLSLTSVSNLASIVLRQ